MPLATSPVRSLRISLIQTSLHWHQPERNRAMFEDLILPLKGKTELVVLPETFTSGFSVYPEDELNKNENERTSNWLIELAERSKCAITGSIAYRHRDESSETDSRFSNRMLFARPDGSLEHYDKCHLFRMAGEHNRYQAGNKRVVVNFMDWKILLCVCYDLRFPVFCRNQDDYDLLLCVANWPESRRQPWRKLLQARAIENLSYVAGVNRIGTDGNGLDYSGDSMLVDFKGDLLIDREPNSAFVETRELDATALHEFKTRFPAWQDADDFELKL